MWVAGALGMVAVLAAAMGWSDGGEGAEGGWMAVAERREWVELMEDADLCATQVESACFDGSVVQFGTVLDLRTATSQKCESVPKRARI